MWGYCGLHILQTGRQHGGINFGALQKESICLESPYRANLMNATKTFSVNMWVDGDHSTPFRRKYFKPHHGQIRGTDLCNTPLKQLNVYCIVVLLMNNIGTRDNAILNNVSIFDLVSDSTVSWLIRNVPAMREWVEPYRTLAVRLKTRDSDSNLSS